MPYLRLAIIVNADRLADLHALRAAADAQTYAEMADEAAEARRAELEEDGHRSMASRRDHLFDPEVV